MRLRLSSLLTVILLGCASAAAAALPVHGVEVKAAYPHDARAYTQGLLYLGGDLYESTGLEGRSTIRRVRLSDGVVLQQKAISPELFGEGLVNWGDELISVTWRDQVGFRWDLKTFALRSSFRYPGEGWALAQKLLDRAAVLFAWEQVGGAQAALEQAREYALGRYAFGRPIASYQAIKHKLATMYVKNTLARSNCYFGAWALNTNAAELPVAAATARVSATQAYYFASKENIQTHGGMGYTWEFDCQFFYRRAKLLSVAIGSERQWQNKLITAVEHSNAA